MTNKAFWAMATAAAVVAIALPADAAVTLGSTGIDGNWKVGYFGNAATAPTDQQASATSNLSAAQTVTSPDAGWVANDAASQWVSLTANDVNNPGWYAYSNTFTAAAGDVLNFQYAADDYVSRILLNGAAVVASQTGSYNSLTKGSVSGMLNGSNTLTFLVGNNYPGGTNPVNATGFRLQAMSGAVPEPASWALMIGGMGLVGASLRRRRTNVSFA